METGATDVPQMHELHYIIHNHKFVIVISYA